jgi:thioredoxin reductase (NADPH)
VQKLNFSAPIPGRVTLLQHERALDPAEIADLRSAGVEVLRPVGELHKSADGIEVSIDGTGPANFEMVYPALGCNARSQLASNLGAETTEFGCLKVDEHQQTTLTGMYAAGDVVSNLHQITVGTCHAAIAATHIHKALTFHPR